MANESPGSERRVSAVQRRRFLKAVGVGGVAGLAGCTGGGDGGDGGGGGDDTTTTTAEMTEETTAATTESGGDEPITLTVARGSEGTATSAMSVGWSELVKEETGGSISLDLQASGGTLASTRLLGNGDVDVGHVQSKSQENAYRGNDPFEQEYRNLGILFTDFVAVNPLAYTLTDTGLDYLSDLPGTTLAGGPPGSSPHPSLVEYLTANGDWDGDDTIQFRKVSYPEGANLVINGRVAACVGYTINHSLASWTDEFITRRDDAKIVLPESEERVTTYTDNSLGTAPFELRGADLRHAWENSAASGDTHTVVGQPGAWVANAGVSEDAAYRITKIAIEGRAALPEYHSLWNGFADDPEGIGLAYKSDTAPYHPGAITAFEEAGFDTSGLAVLDV